MVIQPTSPAQVEAANTRTVPPIEQITEDTWVIPTAMPSPDNPYTFSYVLLDSTGAAHIVDAGLETDENEAVLFAGLESLGVTRVASVFVTHLHPDHLGLAARIRDRTGAAIVMQRTEQEAADEWRADTSTPESNMARWHVPADRTLDLPAHNDTKARLSDTQPDIVVDDGTVLDVPGRELVALLTPGHTKGHMCIRDVDQKLLFTGDHLLPIIFPGLGLGGPTPVGPIGEYLASLDKVRVFDDHEALPGHYYRFRGIEERCASTAAHHLKRSREVAEILDSLPDATVWEVAERISWTAGWDNLTDFYKYSALSQTEGHIKYLRSLAA